MSCSPARVVMWTRWSRSCCAEPPLPDHPQPRVRRHHRRAVAPGQAVVGRDLPDPCRHAAARPVGPGRPAASAAAQHLHRRVPARPPGLCGIRERRGESGGRPALRPGLRGGAARAPGPAASRRGYWPCSSSLAQRSSRHAQGCQTTAQAATPSGTSASSRLAVSTAASARPASRRTSSARRARRRSACLRHHRRPTTRPLLPAGGSRRPRHQAGRAPTPFPFGVAGPSARLGRRDGQG
jgi:hypothetical protein